MSVQDADHLRIEAGSIAKFQRETPRVVATCVFEKFVDAFEIGFRCAKIRGELEQDRSQFMFQGIDTFQKIVPRLLYVAQPLDVSDIARRLHYKAELVGRLLVPRGASLLRWQPIERVVDFD